MKPNSNYVSCKKAIKRMWQNSAALVAFILVIQGVALAQQVSPGLAPLVPPPGKFGIDGDLIANSPNTTLFSNSGDWLPNGGGTGGSVLYGTAGAGHLAGDPIDTFTFHSLDQFTSGDDIFNGGQKKNDNPNFMSWKRGNPSPAKNDINHFMVHFSRDTSNSHIWIVLSGDREVTNGNSFLSLQFLQKTLTQQPNSNPNTAGGTFQSAGTDGGRTIGDLQVSAEFVNGGGNPNLYLERWENVPGEGYKWVPYPFPAGAAMGAVNPVVLTNNVYTSFGINTYQPNAFMEVAIDITEIVDAVGGNECLGRISTLWPMTKSSQAESANMTDFVTPLQINLTINADLETTDPAALCGGTYDLEDAITSDKTGLTFEYYDTYPGLGVNPLGSSIVNQSGTYYIKAISGLNTLCNSIDTVNVTINDVPAAPGTAPLTYCQFETAAQLTATGSNLLWYDSAQDTTGTATAPTPDTDTAGVYTFYVTQTVNGCESPMASLSVTVKELPAAPAVDSIAYCKDAVAVPLTATGSNLLWYDSAQDTTGSATAPTPATDSVGVFNFYVSQTVNDCEGPKAELVVTINDLLAEPTLLIVNPTCSTATGTVRVISPANTDNANPDYHFSFDNGTTYDTVSIYTFQAGGGYSVRVKNLSSGCESPDATCTAADPTRTASPIKPANSFGVTGIESELTAYPIPFYDNVTIEFTASQTENYVVNMYDLRGNLVKQLKAGEAKAGELIRIDVNGSRLTESMYLVRKVSKSGISTIKLLKKE